MTYSDRHGFCDWSNSQEIYSQYHDYEWGKPEYESKKLFEILALETFQAGLSWIIVLKKRENFRKAFDNFDPKLISEYSDNKISELIKNGLIIRNKKKILSTINNAKIYNNHFSDLYSFSSYLWNYVNYKPVVNFRKKLSDIPKSTNLSKKISKEMKELGFSYCGTLTIYSFMQASGMVNDHLVTCPNFLKCQSD